MKTLLVSTIIASLTLANAPASAGGFDGALVGGLVGGIAAGLITGAIESQRRPHIYYVPRRYAPRPRVIVVRAPPVVVQHTVTETVRVPFAVPVAVPVNGLIGVAPAPATTVTTPVIINNAPAPAPAAAPVIVVNQAPAQSPAPVAPPTAVEPSIAILAERCQHDFSKTEDYLGCVKGTLIVDRVVSK